MEVAAIGGKLKEGELKEGKQNLSTRLEEAELRWVGTNFTDEKFFYKPA